MTHLYVKLVERETRQFQQRIAHINHMLPALQSAEVLASRANGLFGMHAKADACEQGYPFISVSIQIERMQGLDVAGTLTEAMGESVIACLAATGEYLVLLDDDGNNEEGSALRVKVEAR